MLKNMKNKSRQNLLLRHHTEAMTRNEWDENIKRQRLVEGFHILLNNIFPQHTQEWFTVPFHVTFQYQGSSEYMGPINIFISS